MLLGKQIGLIGAGNMTESLVCGMLQAGVAHADQLHATDLLPERRAHLQSRYKIRVGGESKAAAESSQIIILSVEPQVLDEVLNEIRRALAAEALLVSVAAGSPVSRAPARVEDPVASHAGAAIAGIHKLEEGRLRATLMAAVEAATKRSQELGQGVEDVRREV